MVEPKYKRILIKLSGEALAGERGVGIDIKTVQNGVENLLLKQGWTVSKQTTQECLGLS